jgi:hypothetical protein
MKKSVLILSAACLLLTLFPGASFAGAPWGEMLPKGVNWFRLYYISTVASEKFDQDGERISGDKTPVSMGTVEGNIVPDGHLRAYSTVLGWAYGVTDNFNIGMEIPYLKWTLDADLNWEGTPSNFPSLYPAYFTPIEQEAEGIGDIKVGAQYRFYKTEKLSSTFRMTTKLPTGKVDDPDDPNDISVGSGQAYIELTDFLDYRIPEKDLILSGQLRCNVQLAGKYDSAQADKATLGDTYRKDPGDQLWIALGIEKFNLITKGLSASLRLEGRFSGEDNYSSDSEAWDTGKEKNTDTTLYFIQPEIKHSFWKSHKFPLRIYCNYRIPLRGRNTEVLNRLELGADIFF